MQQSKPIYSRPDAEWLEERAAILEFDAGMPRKQAEQKAAQLAQEAQRGQVIEPEAQ